MKRQIDYYWKWIWLMHLFLKNHKIVPAIYSLKQSVFFFHLLSIATVISKQSIKSHLPITYLSNALCNKIFYYFFFPCADSKPPGCSYALINYTEHNILLRVLFHWKCNRQRTNYWNISETKFNYLLDT